MGDDKVKTFQEEFPYIFDGTDSLINARLKKQESEMDGLIDRKLREREFAKALNDAYPGWQQTWRTPEFQAFLNRVEKDALLEQPNYFFIEKAFRDLDSETMLRFFKIFFSTKSKTQTPSTSSGRAMSSEQARRELRELAMEKSRGLWRGREKEYSVKERDLWRAIDGNR